MYFKLTDAGKREKCPCLELFWSVFSSIQKILRIILGKYSVSLCIQSKCTFNALSNVNLSFGESILMAFFFFFWEHSVEKLKSCIEDISKLYPTIKFTAEWFITTIIFLNMLIALREVIIKIDLYAKSTVSH